MSATAGLPGVGDEVHDGDVLATVTGVRDGVIWLRAPGRDEWPTSDPARLTVTRTRTQRIASGDL